MSGPVAQCSEAVEREATRRLVCSICKIEREFSTKCPKCGECNQSCPSVGGDGFYMCCNFLPERATEVAAPAPHAATSRRRRIVEFAEDVMIVVVLGALVAGACTLFAAVWGGVL